MPLEGILQGSRPKLLQGRLCHRVQVVRPTKAQDSAGGTDIRQNTVVYTCWASIEALTASEKFAAHEFASVVSHKVIVRHPRRSLDPTGATSGFTADMQIWFNTRQFQIEGVLNPDEKKAVVVLMCVELDDSVNQQTASSAESAL